MSIALVVTRGFGNGTLVGSIADIVTRGYRIGEAIVVTGAVNMVALSADRSITADTVDRSMNPNIGDRNMAVTRNG